MGKLADVTGHSMSLYVGGGMWDYVRIISGITAIGIPTTHLGNLVRREQYFTRLGYLLHKRHGGMNMEIDMEVEMKRETISTCLDIAEPLQNLRGAW